MATPEELAAFDAAFDQTARTIDAGHTGSYATEIADLLHLSGQAETEGTIAVTPTKTYAQLIALVQQASATNLAQADLKSRIVKLGDTAVEIAKKVGGLAKLFA
jgi:hypothetical protein